MKAMKLAVKEAKKEYEHELAETSKFKADVLFNNLMVGKKKKCQK